MTWPRQRVLHPTAASKGQFGTRLIFEGRKLLNIFQHKDVFSAVSAKNRVSVKSADCFSAGILFFLNPAETL